MATIATSVHPPISASSRRRTPFGAIAVVGGLLLLLGLTLSPLMFFDASPYSEIAATPTHLVLYAMWMLCLIALSQAFPQLGGMAGPAGRRLSAVAAVVAGGGMTFKAAAWFLLAFGNPSIAAHAPQMLDTTPDLVILLPGIAAEMAAMVGMIWLAVSGWRSGVFPRAAVILLILASIAVPVLGPLSNVPLGAALLWIGIAGARRD